MVVFLLDCLLMKKISIGTVFSGIGAPEQALLKLGVRHQVLFACDNGEREPSISEEDLRALVLSLPKELREERTPPSPP